MVILRLVHEHLGVCAYQAIYGGYTKKGMVEKWKKKYGKKFDECLVVEEDTNAARKVVHIPDGEIFDSPTEAATYYGVSFYLVKQHCQKQLIGNYTPYRFRWA